MHQQHLSPRRARSKQDSRAHTPEARAIREERSQRRLLPAESESARAMYSFWLSDFMSSRQPAEVPAPEPAQPYPLGRLHARRFLAQVKNAHHAMLAGY